MESGGDSQWRKRGNALCSPPKQRSASIRSAAAGGGGDSHDVLAPQSRREPLTSSKATSSSSAAALDAYLAKYDMQLESFGQQHYHRHHKVHAAGFRLAIDGRLQSCSHGPVVVPPRGTSAQIQLQPESPLSRFKKQAAHIAWKKKEAGSREAIGDDDAENSDSSNLVGNPDEPFPVELTHMLKHSASDAKESQPSDNRQGVSSLFLTSSVTTQALLDRVCEAKLLGGQRESVTAMQAIAAERQQVAIDQRVQTQRPFPIAEAVEAQETGMTKSSIDNRVPNDLSDDDTHVKIVASTVPSPALITRRSELDVTKMPLSERSHHKGLLPIPDARRETQQPKKASGESSSSSVEAIVRVSNAAVVVQRAWRNRRERELQRAFCVLEGTPDCHPSSNEINLLVEEQSDQLESLEVAFALPRPPQSVRSCMASATVKQLIETEGGSGASLEPDPVSVSERFEEDATGLEAAVVPPQALWVDDDWVCLEEGKYLGHLTAVLGSQSALSSVKDNAEAITIWRHPQRLIQRRESERIAWLQYLKRHKGTLARLAPNDLKLREELCVDKVPSILTQRDECERVGSLICNEADECVSVSSKLSRMTRCVPLPRREYRRKRRATREIRVLVRSLRKGSEQSELGSHADAGVKGTEQSSCYCHVQSCSASKDEEEKATALDVTKFVIFSSFESEHHPESTMHDQRNDLISITIADEIGRGGLQSSTTSSESCRSDDSSRIDPRELDNVHSSGFIPLSCTARNTSTSVALSPLPILEAESQLNGGKRCCNTASALQLRASSGNEGRDGTVESPPRKQARPISENDRQKLSDVVGIETEHDEEPAKEVLDNNRFRRYGTEANATSGRSWQQHFDSESCAPQSADEYYYEINGLASVHGTDTVHVDAAKKEEFRRILDEFRESLRRSSSSQHSSSDSLSESWWCSSSQWIKSELSSESSLLLEDEPTLTSATSRGEAEDDDEAADEELQAMLLEIHHFKHAVGNKVRLNDVSVHAAVGAG